MPAAASYLAPPWVLGTACLGVILDLELPTLTMPQRDALLELANDAIYTAIEAQRQWLQLKDFGAREFCAACMQQVEPWVGPWDEPGPTHVDKLLLPPSPALPAGDEVSFFVQLVYGGYLRSSRFQDWHAGGLFSDAELLTFKRAVGTAGLMTLAFILEGFEPSAVVVQEVDRVWKEKRYPHPPNLLPFLQLLRVRQKRT